MNPLSPTPGHHLPGALRLAVLAFSGVEAAQAALLQRTP